MNRRTITASVLAAAALLAVTGCQKQNGITTGETVSFGVSVAGQSGAKSASGTRAVLYNKADDIQTEDNAFACSAYNDSKKEPVFTDETVTYSSGKWSASKDYIWQPGETLIFHAVYPATAAGTGDGNAVIASDGTGIGITNYAVADNAADQIDLMLGYFTGNGNTSGVANIKFDHPFTAVRFKMGDLADFIPGFEGITSITISNVYSGGTLGKWSGSGDFAWTPSSTMKGVTMDISGTFEKGTDIVGTDANAEAFTLIPQEMSDKPATITVNYNAAVDGSIMASINSVPASDDTWKAGKVYTYTVNLKTFDLTIDDSNSVNGWIADAATNVNAEKEDYLPGIFSVSPTKKVRFAKGNLVATVDATGTPVAWKFAGNQYDRLGEGGANKTIGTAAGDVDLFGWSTAATNYGISTSAESSSYSGDFVDWGTAIDNKGTWRTLSQDEWNYLLGSESPTREDAWSKTGLGTVGTAKGVIILPDEFTDPETNRGSGAFIDRFSSQEWNANEYATGGGWEAMQAAGAVFFPISGFRWGGAIENLENNGQYWSSSPYDATKAKRNVFERIYCWYPLESDRFVGQLVRLVTDVQ